MTTPTPPAKTAGYLSRFSPIPAFPEYTGPYKVGTMDVEIPVADLNSPSPAPESAADIPTVQFRVFYPAVSESQEKHIPWLPNPQRHHVSAYTKFIGIGHTLAEFLSYDDRFQGARQVKLTTADSCLDTFTTPRSPPTRTRQWSNRTPRTSAGRL